MSANSKEAIRESYVLIIKLLERTRERKIEWTSGDEFSFRAKLGHNLIGKVWENDQSIGFKLMELNSQTGPPSPPHLNQLPKDYEREVVSICLRKDDVDSDKLTDESIVYEDLATLLELVRHAPVQADERIEQARKYLDQLAS